MILSEINGKKANFSSVELIKEQSIPILLSTMKKYAAKWAEHTAIHVL